MGRGFPDGVSPTEKRNPGTVACCTLGQKLFTNMVGTMHLRLPDPVSRPVDVFMPINNFLRHEHSAMC